ncbi:hypothetical protein C3E98_030980, partial [Pseudomonas sp. MWU13-2625]
PAVICRLGDLRDIKVNQGVLEMTGYARDQVIGRSVDELDVLEDAEHKELAVERLGQGATIPQMQAELRLPEGGSKLVIVAGQPLDINDEDCMLFSFMDLEPRRKAEIALRQSEERFAKSFRLTPVPTLVCSAEQQIVDVNESFLDTCGYSSEELLGKTVQDIGFIAEPQAAEQVRRQAQELSRKAQAAPGEFAASAAQYFQDRDSAQRGGDPGLQPLAQLLPPVRSAVARRNVGGVSEVVQRAAGFHVLTLTEQQSARTARLAELYI